MASDHPYPPSAQQDAGDNLAAPWPAPPLVAAPASRQPRDRVWLHVLLLLLTFATTTWIGGVHYLGFLLDFGRRDIDLTQTQFLLGGLWYSLTILAILGAHEMGHYLACRYYRVSATLPFFLPAPPPFFTGTFGAFIRIRSPIETKPILFDIGFAGPIAGFVVAVPALFLGLFWSTVVEVPASFESGLWLGEPLLFRLASWTIWGPIQDGFSINLHPIAFAAWFGLLATALNLFPIGQLDGGHIAYAALGWRSTYVTIGSIAAAVVLTFFSLSWVVWTVMLVVMLVLFGPRHPRTADDHVPLDGRRLALALFALVMFVLCFTPAPISEIDLTAAQ